MAADLASGIGPARKSVRSQGRSIDGEVMSFMMMSGVLGGLVMTVVLAMARGLGLILLNIERSFGALVVGQAGLAAWFIGLLLHLALSAFFALIYTEIFRAIGTASWKLGAAFGFIQWIIIGTFLGVLPSLRPVMTSMLTTPGAFGLNSGSLGFTLLLFLHLAFGAIVGSAYAYKLSEYPHVLGRRRHTRRI